MIYFIQVEPSGSIKIGTTNVDAYLRMRALRAAITGELSLLGTISGSYREEKLLHEKFKDLRLWGEWFRPASELLGYIKDNATMPTRGPAAFSLRFPNSMLLAIQSIAKIEGRSVNQEIIKAIRGHIEARKAKVSAREWTGSPKADDSTEAKGTRP